MAAKKQPAKKTAAKKEAPAKDDKFKGKRAPPFGSKEREKK